MWCPAPWAGSQKRRSGLKGSYSTRVPAFLLTSARCCDGQIEVVEKTRFQSVRAGPRSGNDMSKPIRAEVLWMVVDGCG